MTSLPTSSLPPARAELGWTPRGLEEGLGITLDYLKKQEVAKATAS